MSLPRLKAGPRDRPSVSFVGTAFVRARDEAATGPAGSFEEYFTYESLFDEPEPTIDPFAEDHATLRVAPGAPWDDVVAAHRALVKELHPDHMLDASADAIIEATDQLRRINEAYARLRAVRHISRAT